MKLQKNTDFLHKLMLIIFSIALFGLGLTSGYLIWKSNETGELKEEENNILYQNTDYPKKNTIYIGYYRGTIGAFWINSKTDGDQYFTQYQQQDIDYQGIFIPQKIFVDTFKRQNQTLDLISIDFRELYYEDENAQKLFELKTDKNITVDEFIIIPEHNLGIFNITLYDNPGNYNSKIYKFDFETKKAVILWDYEKNKANYNDYIGGVSIIERYSDDYIILQKNICEDCDSDEAPILIALNINTGEEVILGAMENVKFKFNVGDNKLLVEQFKKIQKTPCNFSYFCPDGYLPEFESTNEVKEFHLP